MNQAEQKEFIETFMNSVKKSILSKVENGYVPENWDGFELRHYIADKFTYETYEMDKKRAKSYKNDVATLNL